MRNMNQTAHAPAMVQTQDLTKEHQEETIE